jgi:hypothetical protein
VAADDHLSPAQFFHGSSYKVPVGGFIEPGGERESYNKGAGYGSENHAHATDTFSAASHYADMNGMGRGVSEKDSRVYRVAPVGDFREHYPDANGNPRPRNEYDMGGEYVAPKWKVLSEHPANDPEMSRRDFFRKYGEEL